MHSFVFSHEICGYIGGDGIDVDEYHVFSVLTFQESFVIFYALEFIFYFLVCFFDFWVDAFFDEVIA